MDTAYEEFGRVDILVNNVGLSPLYPSLDGVTEALYDKTLAVNLKGPFRLNALTEGFARAFGPSVRVNCIQLYFAGPASAFCTGAILRLDGGVR